MNAPLDHQALERLLAGAEALPSCPPVLAKVAEICSDPASSARTWARSSPPTRP